MDRRLALAWVELIKQRLRRFGVILRTVRGRRWRMDPRWNSRTFVHYDRANHQRGLSPITAKWPVVVETARCIKAEEQMNALEDGTDQEPRADQLDNKQWRQQNDGSGCLSVSGPHV